MSRMLTLGEVAKRATWWASDYLTAAAQQIRASVTRSRPEDFIWGEREPVLILPGVYEPWGFMLPLIRDLHRRGHPVHIVELLRHNRISVEGAASLVNELLRERDLNEVMIVAHSKGGLIGKFVMAFGSESRRLRGMVAVATPFAGSRYARYFVGKTLRTLSPTDPTILQISQATAPNARIVSVFPRFDPHIPEGSVLQGARNVRIDTGGHFRILAHPRAIAAVRRAVASSPQASYSAVN